MPQEEWTDMLTTREEILAVLVPGSTVYLVRAGRSDRPRAEQVRVIRTEPSSWGEWAVRVILVGPGGLENIAVAELCCAPGKGVCLTAREAGDEAMRWKALWSQDPGWVLGSEIEDYEETGAVGAARPVKHEDILLEGIF